MLLARPPSFIPTPTKCSNTAIRSLVIDFVHKIQRRTSFFRSSSSQSFQFGRFPSSRWPPEGLIRPPVRRLSMRIFVILGSYLSRDHKYFGGSNISLSEKKALSSLPANPSFVIRLADKGGQWVVIDSVKYKVKCVCQIANNCRYL